MRVGTSCRARSWSREETRVAASESTWRDVELCSGTVSPVEASWQHDIAAARWGEMVWRLTVGTRSVASPYLQVTQRSKPLPKCLNRVVLQPELAQLSEFVEPRR